MRMRDIFFGTCIVLGTLVAGFTLYKLTHLIIVLFVALIFASTVRPILRTLTRYRVPSWAAIVMIYGVTLISVILLLVIALPPMVSVSMELMNNSNLLPELSYSLMRTGLTLQRQFGIDLPIMTVPTQLQRLSEMTDETLREQAWTVTSTAFYTMGQILLAVVISVYWLTTRRTALRTLLRISPRAYQPLVSRIWIDTEDMLGGYLRGQIILGLMVGTASFVGLTILRVPNALALAVIAGLLEFVPFIGPIAAAVPAVLFGLTVSPLTALLIGGWYLLVQQIEGNFLIPRIMGQSTSVHPLIVLIAIFAGFQLNGVVGALLAVPIAGLIQVMVRHLPAAVVDVPTESTANEAVVDVDAAPA